MAKEQKSKSDASPQKSDEASEGGKLKAEEPKHAVQEQHPVPAVNEVEKSNLGSKTTGGLVATDDDPVMMFPKPVMLNFGGIMYKFAQGVHRVPRQLADHWYLKHNKVEVWKE